MASQPAEIPLPDATERARAATTFDVNVVVTAGAGTGKTTLLVDRLVHLLMRDPDPLAVTQILALTFTNKAANEMRLRLRERLESYRSTRLDTAGNEPAKIHNELRSLIQLYHLTKDEIDRRAQEALRQLERSYIGTIHSFSAMLLRLYPLEAGVDPQFKEDDGSMFLKHFDEEWSVWLDRELGRDGSRAQAWKRVLAKLSLDTLRQVGFSLCSEMIPLVRLGETFNGRKIDPTLSAWLAALKRDAEELIKRYPDNHNQIDCFARSSHRILQTILERGEIPAGELEQQKRWFFEKSLRRAGRWSEADYEKLQRLCTVARGLMRVDADLVETVWELLVPFAEHCRASFVTQGFVSFDGLLVRARNLLRDHTLLREELKSLFKAILIDEFQDTDPIQYEILLYLAEKPGASASNWRSVQIQPGKVFVVGDPKQSIYSFRRADIQGYLKVVQEIILAQGGVECPLTTNFRSHSGILHVVNGVFEQLIREKPGLQTDYVPIQPPIDEENTFGSAEESSFRQVRLCRIESEEELKANSARRLEAENLARWLGDDVLGKARIRDRQGEWITAQPKHVAFLFRKLTEVHLYLEPLRRRAIPYIVEGEKHFYATQEVIDGVNLLRAVTNPYDRAALVGVLRSPVGGFSDRQIYDLHRNRLLDYRVVRRGGTSVLTELEPVLNLYAALDRLHAETRTLSVADAVHRIFKEIPIRILAARSFNGEQALANLEKIRQQAAIMGRAGLGTLKDVIAQLERRVLETEEEAESALAEEAVDAVKILSIHKAKGLEFPIVVLPDARGAANSGPSEAGVEYDWSSNLIALRAVDYSNLAAVYLDARKRSREEEEQKRLFYVAMTRARDHVMISSPPLKIDKGSFVEMLQKCVPKFSASPGAGLLSVGAGKISIHVLKRRREAPRLARQAKKDLPAPGDWNHFVQQWTERRQKFAAGKDRPLFLSPTALKNREIEVTEQFDRKPSRGQSPFRKGDCSPVEANDGLLIGTLAHGFLERFDFCAGQINFQEPLARYLEQHPQCAAASVRTAAFQELSNIFDSFFRSTAFAELSGARILGREIPLLMSCGGHIVEGVIDLLYERDCLLYIADYKTDRIESDDFRRVSERYRHQAEIYSEAVRRSLEREVAAFKLIFLRLGEAIEVTPNSQGELSFV